MDDVWIPAGPVHLIPTNRTILSILSILSKVPYLAS